MHRSRAAHHVDALVARCAARHEHPGPVPLLPVVALAVFGALADGADDLEVVDLAVVVDLPEDAVPWGCPPTGAQHWAQATGAARLPVRPVWRSSRGPRANHRVVRPLTVWTAAGGPRPDVLAALRDGSAGPLRDAAVAAPEAARTLAAERDLALRVLTARAQRYREQRWAPGPLERLADPLQEAAAGYLDLLAADA